MLCKCQKNDTRLVVKFRLFHKNYLTILFFSIHTAETNSFLITLFLHKFLLNNETKNYFRLNYTYDNSNILKRLVISKHVQKPN